MSWLSIHFYPNETQDVFLSRALKPFLAQYIWPNKETRAFFVRFQDEKGPHLRLRFKVAPEWATETLLPAFEGWFAGRGEWEQVAYVAETARFGGEDAMAWSEEYFHIATRVVLDRISRDQFTYGDAMFDALRLHVIAAFAAGLTRDKSRWYFGQLYDQWLPLFFSADPPTPAAEISSAFEKTFAPQQAQIAATLDSFWKSLETEKFDIKQPEWVRWLRGNQLVMEGLGDTMEKALPSLLHLTNNRMGINNQDEVYLNYILAHAL